MKLPALLALGALALVPAGAAGVARVSESRLSPASVSPLPSFVRKIEPAIVGLHVKAAEAAASSARLGTHRAGSGIIFDRRGYLVTVTYLVLDAERIEARTRDGRRVPGRVVGLDFNTGLAVVGLEGEGSWPAAVLGDSRDLAAGATTGLVGVDEDNDLVHAAGTVQGIRRFTAPWEYMLERAFILTPAVSSWGGSAMVDDQGRLVGVVSLRLGAVPYVNLAIPLEVFLPVKDELIATGRIDSRPSRPWLGLQTTDGEAALVVVSLNPTGPARGAGVREGDRILAVDGTAVETQETFYAQLWRRRAGDVIELTVVREGVSRVIAVRSVDRGALYRTAP